MGYQSDIDGNDKTYDDSSWQFDVFCKMNPTYILPSSNTGKLTMTFNYEFYLISWCFKLTAFGPFKSNNSIFCSFIFSNSQKVKGPNYNLVTSFWTFRLWQLLKPYRLHILSTATFCKPEYQKVLDDDLPKKLFFLVVRHPAYQDIP